METETTTREVDENTAAGTNIGAAVSATDPDLAGTNTDANPETSTPDTLTYTLSGTTDQPNDYQTFDIDTATGQLKTKDALDYETKTSYKMTVSVSDGTLSDTITVTINITNVNEVPTFPATTATTLEIAENTAANTNIGDPVTATDPDSGDTLTYSFDATGDTTFDIDSSTGQLKTSAALDFETKNSYTVTVTATDSNSLTATIEVTINITNVNEAPTFPATTDTTLEIAENTATGTAIGVAVSATDPDVAGTNTDVNPDDATVDALTYTLGGTDAASFDIVSTSGQLQTKAALDYETDNSYSVTVTVSDGGTDTASVAITISVTNVNEAPTFPATTDTTLEIAENTATGTDIGAAVTATDPDVAGTNTNVNPDDATVDALTYTLGGTDATSFDIVSTSGQLQTKAALDYETDNSYTVTVTVSDGGTDTASVTVTINVTNVNEAPTFPATTDTTLEIAENTGAGTDIGAAVSATDPDVAGTNTDVNLDDATVDALTYTLGGTDAASFDIVSTSGQLQTKAALDYETDNSYTVTVTASDGGTDTASITVTISVTNVNEAPTFPATTDTRSIAENTGAGTDIGAAVSATDPDVAGTNTDVNPDDATVDALTYTLGGTDAASFDIVSTSGQLQTKAALDYETKDSYEVTVTVSDGGTDTASVTVTISVTDVNETGTNNAPEFTDGDSTTRSVAENTAAGEDIGSAVEATDDDSGDTLTYTLGGTDAASFDIVGTSGQLQTKSALDYEATKNSYSVTVSVSDGNSGSDSIDVTINVTNINEAPTFPATTDTTLEVTKHTPEGTDIGDPVAATDPDVAGTNTDVNLDDATVDVLTYTLGGTDATSFDIDSETGQLKTKTGVTFDRTTQSSYMVTVTASDGEFTASTPVVITVVVTPVCDRTLVVRDAIVAEVPGVTDCADVTETHLAAITGPLNLANKSITALKAGDFDGLTALTTLDLSNNQIRTLPSVVFGELTALTTLDLNSNQIRTLPPVVFGELTALTTLRLNDNQLTTLPAVVFDQLTALTTLRLSGNRLRLLDEDVFDGLTALTGLFLTGNQLINLKEDVFDGLTALTTLLLDENQLISLEEDVFEGLTALATLRLTNNKISPLPAGVFEGLTALTTLYLDGADLTALPADVFEGLTALTTLTLDDNDLTALPADVFEGLTALTTLTLPRNDITALPADVFEGLTTLSVLRLNNNKLSTLPAGVFDGLTAFTRLFLNNNTVNPLPLTVSLKQVAEGEFKATAHTGAPFGIVLPVTVTNGTINGGATTITVPTGNVESGSLTVTRTIGTTATVTVTIGTLPGLPANHTGYALSKSSDLPLKVISDTSNNAPEFTDGTETTRLVAENAAAGQNIGSAVAATDDDAADTLTYRLNGTDADSFDIVSTTAQLKTKAVLDRKTKSSYSVTVVVTDGNGGIDSIAVTITVTEPNNVPEFTDGTETTREVAENTASDTAFSDPVAATDDDPTDTLTYTLGGTDAASFAIVSSSGQLKTKAALDYEATKNSYSVTVSVSDSTHTDSIDVTINVTNINEAPAFPATTDTTLEVTKHTPVGTDIGDPVAATDPDVTSTNTDVNPDDATVDALTYTLGGTDAASFDIDSDTGQLKTKTGVAFDRTTQSSYMVTVTASDGEFTASTSVGITVVVTPVCDRTPAVRDAIVAAVPGVSDCADVTETHLAAITGPLSLSNKSITALKAGDFDGLTALETLSLSRNQISTLPAAVFDELTALTELDLYDNQISTLPAAVFDKLTALTELYLNNNQISTLPAAVFDEITALTTLALDSNQISTLTAGVFDKLTVLTTLYLSYNQISTLPAAVFDKLTALTELYLHQNQISTLPAAVFDKLTALTTLYLNSNQISMLIAGVFDELTALTRLDLDYNQISTLTEEVFDKLTALTTLSLHHNQISTLPAGVFDELTALTTLYLNSNQISTLTAGVFDKLTALTRLDLDNNQISTLPAGVFDELTALTRLDLDNNQISTLPAGVFEGLTALTTLNLNNNMVNPLPLTVSLKQVAEGEFKATAHTGAPFEMILPVTVTNGTLDGGATTITIPIGNVESGSLTVTRTIGTTAAVTVDIGTLPGLPSGHQGYALSKSSDLPLKVISETSNNAPEFTDGTETTRLVAENTAAGENIGSAVAATDDDTTDTLTYRLNGTDADSFAIVSTTGQLKTKAALDYATKNEYSVTVVVTDGNGGINSIAVTINVTEANDAPTFTDGTETTREVAENTAAAEDIGSAVAATDDDSGDTLTYTLSGTDAASFDIVSTSGQLKTKAALDYETDNSYSVTVGVSDGNGGTDSIDVTINVTNVNEAPTFPGTTDTRSVAENTEAATNIGAAVAATDPDVAGTNTDVNPDDAIVDALTYTLGGTDAASFAIVSTSGQLQTKAALDYETDNSYSVTVTVSDGGTDTASVTVTINVTNVNEAPTFPATTATRSVAENTEATTNIGAAVAATDPDVAGTNTDVNPDDAIVDALTYTLGGTDAASFDIVSTSGQLQTKAALDYETKNSYEVTVTVSDSGTDTASVTVTISVTDVDETQPTVSITVPSGVQNGAFDVTVVFSEAVTGFVQSELVVTGTSGASITAWNPQTGGTNYEATITPTSSGTAIFNVAANVAKDTADNQNTAATQQTVQVNLTRLTVIINTPSGVQNGAFDVTVVFSEAVTGFVQSELVVTGTSGASITAWNPQTGGTNYEATITPTSSGTAIFNVAANVAKDTADNQNTAATQQTVQVNLTRLTVIINTPSGVQNGAFDVTVVFSEAVTGFVQSELVVTGTSGASITAWNPQTGGTNYEATITPTSSGTAIFNVAANVAKDTADNQNTAATQQTVQVDMTAPTVSITVPSGAQNGAFDVTVVFSEAVTGFVQSELVVTGTSGASITAWNPQTGGTDYEATITPTSSGTAIFNVAANVAKDAADNQNTAATQQTVQVDMTSPTVSITVPSGAQNGAFDVTVVFSEAVTGFVQSELVVTSTSGASITAWNPQTGGTDYEATITPTSSGTAIFNVAANVAKDTADNQNTAATQQTVQVNLTRPTVIINTPSGAQNGAFDVTVVFSEAVTGFVQSELVVTGTSGASITAWNPQTGGTDYEATITPTQTGEAIFNVAANVAKDAADNQNTAATQQTVQVNLTRPTVVINVPSGVQNGAFDVTVVFSEAVTGFVQSELVVTGTSGASITAWNPQTGGTDYKATITPTQTGEAIFNVAANVAVDSGSNQNTAATQQTVQVDMTSPTVSITVPSGVQNGVFDATITFSEQVSLTGSGNITTADSLSRMYSLSGDGTTYTATFSRVDGKDGNVILKVPAGFAKDSADNLNTASDTHTVSVDWKAPTVTITDVPSGTQTGAFDATITFSEDVTGFEASDITLSGTATATATLTGSGSTYTATITPTISGNVVIQVPANAAEDAAGNGNTASQTQTV